MSITSFTHQAHLIDKIIQLPQYGVISAHVKRLGGSQALPSLFSHFYDYLSLQIILPFVRS